MPSQWQHTTIIIHKASKNARLFLACIQSLVQVTQFPGRHRSLTPTSRQAGHRPLDPNIPRPQVVIHIHIHTNLFPPTLTHTPTSSPRSPSTPFPHHDESSAPQVYLPAEKSHHPVLALIGSPWFLPCQCYSKASIRSVPLGRPHHGYVRTLRCLVSTTSFASQHALLTPLLLDPCSGPLLRRLRQTTPGTCGHPTCFSVLLKPS